MANVEEPHKATGDKTESNEANKNKESDKKGVEDQTLENMAKLLDAVMQGRWNEVGSRLGVLLGWGKEQKEFSGGNLGEKMSQACDALMSQRYVFGGRLGEQIPGSGQCFNSGIDCIGVWWYLNQQFKWKSKDGKPFNWQDFSKDGFEHCIPKLSDHYEEFTCTAANQEDVKQKLKSMPDGTLLAYTSHVGVIRNGKLFNASSPTRGVRDDEFTDYYTSPGTKIRTLDPKYIQTG